MQQHAEVIEKGIKLSQILTLGAALPDQTRMKRKATVWDKSFDFLGFHAGLNYKDAAQPLKGGKLSLQIEDLKKIFPQLHSCRVGADIVFDGGEAVDDGLFELLFAYGIMCADGNGNIVWRNKNVGGNNKFIV